MKVQCRTLRILVVAIIGLMGAFGLFRGVTLIAKAPFLVSVQSVTGTEDQVVSIVARRGSSVARRRRKRYNQRRLEAIRDHRMRVQQQLSHASSAETIHPRKIPWHHIVPRKVKVPGPHGHTSTKTIPVAVVTQVAQTVVTVPLQNLTVAFQNPSGTPVAQLHVTVDVKPKAGPEQNFKCVTDASGRVSLARLSIPTQIDCDVDPDQGDTYQSGEYQLAAAQADTGAPGGTSTASFLLDTPIGTPGPPTEAGSMAVSDLAAHVTSARHIAAIPGSRLSERSQKRLRDAGWWSCRTLPRPAGGALRAHHQPTVDPRRPANPPGQPQKPSPRPASTITQAVVYEGEAPAAVVVERTLVDVDLYATAGSILKSPLFARGSDESTISGQDEIAVPDVGHVRRTFKVADVGASPVPIAVKQPLPGGLAEGQIKDYALDPYSRSNAGHAGVMRLVSVNDVKLPIDVLADRKEVMDTFGDLAGRQKHKGTILPQSDGSQLWQYDQGIGIRLRTVPLIPGEHKPDRRNPAPALVESIHLVSAEAGSVAGLSVGSSPEELHKSLGTADSSTAADDGAIVESYLGRGLQFSESGGRITAIDITRPTALLRNGTTAFVPRPQTRLHIREFTGDDRSHFNTRTELETFLKGIGSVRVVPSSEEADLQLDLAVEFEDHQSALDDSLKLPLSYNCTTRLTYTIRDLSTGAVLLGPKTAESRWSWDYQKERFFFRADPDRIRKSLRRSIGLSERIAFREFALDLNHCALGLNANADTTTRVTAVDYAQGTLSLNVGTNTGVWQSTPDRPCDFLIKDGDRELPHSDIGRKSTNTYVARVIEAGPDTCTCQLHHLTGDLTIGGHDLVDVPDTAEVTQILNPATGVVAAEPWVSFPEKDVTAVNPVLSDDAPVRQAASFGPNGWSLLSGVGSVWDDQIPPDAAVQLTRLGGPLSPISEVSFTPEGGWIILTDGFTWYQSQAGIPPGLIAKLEELRQARQPVEDIAFTQDGGWCVLFAVNGHASEGIPPAAVAQLDALAAAGHTIRQASFGAGGSGVILWDQNGYWAVNVPESLLEGLREANHSGKLLRSVAFGPNGSWLLFLGHSSVLSEGVPDTIVEQIHRIGAIRPEGTP